MQPYDPLVFFERSAPALFNITFNSVWMQDKDIHAHVSKAIFSNLSRLRRLTIEVTHFDEIALIFEAWRDCDTPNLIDLEITCHDNSEPEKEIMATYLRCGDSLNRVKLKGLRFGFLPVLHYLTILEIGRLHDPHTLHEILLHTSGLPISIGHLYLFLIGN